VAAIETFMKRFHRAVHSRSPEIRMTLPEANDLAQEINTLLSRLAAQPPPQAAAGPTGDVVMDGGSLKDLR
jgi:hypothetical protein